MLKKSLLTASTLISLFIFITVLGSSTPNGLFTSQNSNFLENKTDDNCNPEVYLEVGPPGQRDRPKDKY